MARDYMDDQRSLLQAAICDLLQRVTGLLNQASKYVARVAPPQLPGKVRMRLCYSVACSSAKLYIDTCGDGTCQSPQ